MAKSQKKTNKEVRKPKADKAAKGNASNPSQKNPVYFCKFKGNFSLYARMHKTRGLPAYGGVEWKRNALLEGHSDSYL